MKGTYRQIVEAFRAEGNPSIAEFLDEHYGGKESLFVELGSKEFIHNSQGSGPVFLCVLADYRYADSQKEIALSILALASLKKPA